MFFLKNCFFQEFSVFWHLSLTDDTGITNHIENGGQSIGVTVHTHESFEDLLQLQRYVGEGWVAGIIGENTLYIPGSIDAASTPRELNINFLPNLAMAFQVLLLGI